MHWLIILRLALVALLIAGALRVWYRHGWRRKKTLIVMLIVLAAALQTVNVVLFISGR